MENDSLIQLIKGMSLGEKIHFKRSLHIKKIIAEKQPAYLKLFNAIDKASDTDKASIHKKLIATEFNANYNETKRYLFEVLIDFLEKRGEENNVQQQLSILINKAELLGSRNCIEECNYFLQKAKSIAIMHELHLHLIRILVIEKTFLIRSNTNSNIIEAYDTIYKQIKEERKKYESYMQYQEYCDKIGILMSVDTSTRDEQIANNLQVLYAHFSSLNVYDTVKIKILKEKFLYSYNYLLANYEVAYTHLLCIEELFQKTPPFMKSEKILYHTNLRQQFILTFQLKKYHASFTIFQKILPLLDEMSNFDKDRYVMMTHVSRMIIHLKKGEIEKLNDSIREAVEKFELKDNEILNKGSVNHLILYYFLSHICMFSGHIKLARHFCNLVDAMKKTKNTVREDVFYSARLLSLLIVYEQKDIFYFENRIKINQQIFRRHDKIYELEEIVFSHLRKLLKIWGDKEEEIAIWKMMLARIEEKFSAAFLENILKFDLILWIKSKIEDRPVIHLLKEQAQKEHPEIFELNMDGLNTVKNL